jgi:hypothetical protein
VLHHNPNGGVAVNSDGSNTAELRVKFNAIDPSQYGARIFVWPDSYEHFDAVRLALADANLEYQLTPCDTNTTVTLGRGSGQGMLVQ